MTQEKTKLFPLCSDAVVSQVLDELGLQLTDQLTGLPIASGSLASTTGIATKAQAAAASAGGTIDADADLQARLNNLRREWTKAPLCTYYTGHQKYILFDIDYVHDMSHNQSKKNISDMKKWPGKVKYNR